MPINAGMTLEEVIESNYPDIEKDDYKYIIQDNFAFITIEPQEGKGFFKVAYKNDTSGYILELPGMLQGIIYDRESKPVLYKDSALAIPNYYKYFDKYYVVELSGFGLVDVEFYCKEKDLITLTLEDSGETKWYMVVSDLSEDFEIMCDFKSDAIHVINKQELLDLF